MRKRAAAIGVLAMGAVALPACRSDSVDPVPEGPAYRLEIVGGDDQTGAAGLALPSRLEVRVTDAGGAPSQGVALSWRALEGGGRAEPLVDTTDATGRAATEWVLGVDLGRHLLLATVDGVQGVTFRAWADLFFTSVSAGWRHSCGLDPVGSAWCWGDNNWGQLGDGTTEASPRSRRVGGGSRLVRVEAGSLHTCGLDAEGRAHCWGDNGLGQLGDGSTGRRLVAASTEGAARFGVLALGGVHTCGIGQGGELYCWGSNQQGQLGVADPGSCSLFNRLEPCATRPVPVPLPGAARRVAAGEAHTCVLDADGGAWCWGRNDWGQLGIGRFGGTAGAPTRVIGQTRFREIAAGPVNTCALDEAGAAWCWGLAAEGVLGQDTLEVNVDRPFPVDMPPGVAFREIGVGDAHACALAESGVWCWGTVVGDGSAGPSRVPVKVGGGAALASLAVGGSHACGFDRGVWCWGGNAHGQLGVPPDSLGAALLPLKVRRSPPE